MRVNWKTICEEIDLGHFQIPFSVNVGDGFYGKQYLYIKRYVKNINNGLDETAAVVFPVIDAQTDLEAVQYIYTIIRNNLLHELAEHFSFQGARIFTPPHLKPW